MAARRPVFFIIDWRAGIALMEIKHRPQAATLIGGRG